MSRMPLSGAVCALLVVAVCIPATPAVAQTPGHVRVVNGPAPVQRWFRAPATDVLVEVEPGTTLEVLDEEGDWFWVIVPPDGHGTRRAGWIRADNVEPVSVSAATAPTRGQRDDIRPLASVSSVGSVSSVASVAPAVSVAPAAGAVPSTATIAEDGVIITGRQNDTASTPANAPASTRTSPFESVHFDLDRDLVRPEDRDRLRAAVTALKADPSLVVNIEGYTCNLGTPAYNLALGLSRANAVKDFLVSEGVAADRLHTVTLGEEGAVHDNSSEDTRKLNRRVALVPDARPF